MQTNFTEDQLKNKDNKSTEKILRKCVHCGMCNATCPTFNLLGDELDGPRGRIYLIKEMIEKKKHQQKSCFTYRQMFIMLFLYDYLSIRCKLYAFN